MAMRTPVNANRLPYIQSVNNYILCVCFMVCRRQWSVMDDLDATTVPVLRIL